MKFGLEGFHYTVPCHFILQCFFLVQQMCIERSELLDVRSNPLFSPVEINLENQPLKNCVISVR